MEIEKEVEVIGEEKEEKRQQGHLRLLGELSILVLSVLLGIGAIFVGSWSMDNAYGNPGFDILSYAFGILLVVVGIAFIMFSILSFLIIFMKVYGNVSSR